MTEDLARMIKEQREKTLESTAMFAIASCVHIGSIRVVANEWLPDNTVVVSKAVAEKIREIMEKVGDEQKSGC